MLIQFATHLIIFLGSLTTTMISQGLPVQVARRVYFMTTSTVLSLLVFKISIFELAELAACVYSPIVIANVLEAQGYDNLFGAKKLQ